MEEKQVKVLGINSLAEVIFKDEGVIAEIVETTIEAPESAEGEEKVEDQILTTWKIVLVGEDVKKYQKGDIIYDVASPHSVSYFEALDKTFVSTDMYNIKLAVRKNG